MDAIGPGLAGHALDPIAWSWTERDTMLYALGIGARLPDELEYLYEARGPRVPATFALAAVTLTLPPLVAALSIDLTALLHASQAIELHRVPAPSGSATVTRRITGVWDKGRAALVDCEDVVDDGGDGPLATARSTWWIAGAGGFGGPRSAATAAPAPPATPQDRAPDLRHRVQTTAEQAALHRLSGDRNPVHIDPEIARAAGQPRPFLHGLCSFGALGQALDRAAATRGHRLTSLSGRFTRPVFPATRWRSRPGGPPTPPPPWPASTSTTSSSSARPRRRSRRPSVVARRGRGGPVQRDSAALNGPHPRDELCLPAGWACPARCDRAGQAHPSPGAGGRLAAPRAAPRAHSLLVKRTRPRSTAAPALSADHAGRPRTPRPLVRAGVPRQDRGMPSVATTVSVRVAAAREPLFDWFIPIELPRILTGWGPVPAVVATSEQTGPWDTPGSRRTVHLADGSTAHERVTACERPASFGYTVDGFSGPVRHVAVEGRGRWTFAAAGDGATDVAWTYTFRARSRAAALLLTPVVKIAWRGFMRRALKRLAALARDEVR